uniref:vWA domain-containing protein n=1 Tax=Roseivirga sp. TaxID=1964215 RepID=UPI004047349F
MFVFIGQISFGQALVKIRSIVHKREIVHGDYFFLSISILVYNSNKTKVQIPDQELLHESLGIISSKIPDKAFFVLDQFSEIQGRNYSDKYGTYSRYDLIRMAISPFDTGKFVIPEYEFPLKVFNNTKKEDSLSNDLPEFNIVPFKSLPVTIQVNQHPLDGSYDIENFPFVGTMSVEKPMMLNNADSSNSLKIILSGGGMGFPLSLSKRELDKYGLMIDAIEYKDSTDLTEKIHFRKTYLLSLSQNVQIDKLNIPFWNSEDQMADTVHIQNLSLQAKQPTDSKEMRVIIGFDGSKSMLLADFSPSRLSKALELSQILYNAYPNSEIFGFSGDSKRFTPPIPTDSLAHKMFSKKGTALGNAVWLGTETLRDNSSDKFLILIGDGDATTGNVNIQRAIPYAIRNGVRVICIGIGSDQEIDYMNDNGEITTVSNSFSDAEFKEVSELTGGRYFWIGDYKDVQSLVQDVKQFISAKSSK